MNSKQRNSNFELLRILTMLCVVASHACSFTFNTEGTLGNFYTLYYTFGYAGLNAFFMISGYFMGTKPTISKKKILSIFVQIMYCQLVALIIFLIFRWSGIYDGKIGGYPGISKMQYFGIFIEFFLLPVTSDTYWYITAYVLLLALIPLINPFLQKLNKKGFIFLLLIEGLLWFAFSEVRHYRYSHLQRAVFFYSLGVFFVLHANQKSLKRLVVAIIAFIPVYAASALLFKAFHGLPEDCSAYKDMIYHYVAYGVLSPVCSIVMFEIFKNLTFSCSAINLISATTFSVYLLHCQPFVGYLRVFLPAMKGEHSPAQIILFNIMLWLITFAFCSALDILRLKVFNKQINTVTGKFLEFANSKLYRS